MHCCAALLAPRVIKNQPYYHAQSLALCLSHALSFCFRLSPQVIKNQPAYYHQARVEVGILQLLNGRCDPGDAHHLVRLHDAFLHRRHLCLAFEQLGINLFELLKRNGFRGLSLGLLRLFLQQVSLFAVYLIASAVCIYWGSEGMCAYHRVRLRLCVS